MVLLPQHEVLKGHAGVVELVGHGDVLIFALGKVGFELDNIGMAFLPQLFLALCQLQVACGSGNLDLQGFCHLSEIEDIAVCLHDCEADLVTELLLLRNAHLDGSLGDFEVIDSLKTIEQRDSTRYGVAVVERGSGDVIVGFGVDSASEVQRGVCAALDSGGEGTEDSFAACDAGIVVVSALDFHFRRMGDGILHAITEGKGGGCAMGSAETEEEKDSILL